MTIKILKRTSIAFATAVALSLGSIGLTTSVQSAPLHIAPNLSSQVGTQENLIQVRSFRGHRGISRGGHRFRGHGHGFKKHKFKRGHGFRSNRHSLRGGFSNHRGHRNHRFRIDQTPGFVLSPKSR